ncbi:MAG: hypothetical protein LUE27_10520 [Clostridia bacterium]|nr:hypothetical protein [Clostridia bacterium]
MGGWQCFCGGYVDETEDPERDLLHICLEKDVRAALAYNPALSWWDFVMERDPLHNDDCKTYTSGPFESEFRLCPFCKRVIMHYRQGGKFLSYIKDSYIPYIPESDLHTLFVFPDLEVFTYTEMDEDISLEEMVYSMPHTYKAKISSDGEHVLLYDRHGKLLCCYVPDSGLFVCTSSDQILNLFPSDP